MPYDINNSPYYIAKMPCMLRVTDHISVVTKDFSYKDRYGVDRVCSRGFMSDGASRPSTLEIMVQKDSLNNGAFLVHDHMYWHQYCNRLECDIRLLINLLLNPNNSPDWCYMVYKTLRLTGWKAWNDNKELQSKFGKMNRYMREQDLTEIENRENNLTNDE